MLIDLALSGDNALVIGTAPGQVITDNSYIPTFPYASGVYSNGPVWATQFAGMLGVPLAPALASGTNYAFGGARTRLEGPPLGPGFPPFPPSLLTQTGALLSAAGGSLPAGALYVVAGGGNNARDTLNAIGLGAAAGSTIFNDAFAYANDVGLIVDSLKAAGAQNIIVWNTPNVGAAPAVLAANALNPISSFLGTLVADAMNAALTTRLAGETGVKIFDIFGLANLPGASVFTNRTDACGVTNTICGTSLFWDGIHPTTAAHTFIAQQMYALAVPVPEPSEIAMMLIGLVVVVRVARRQVA